MVEEITGFENVEDFGIAEVECDENSGVATVLKVVGIGAAAVAGGYAAWKLAVKPLINKFKSRREAGFVVVSPSEVTEVVADQIVED